MGTKTAIEWADATWNPWMGCTPVSEGCAHCYMYRDAKRYGRDPTKLVRASDSTFRMPLSKTRVPAGSFVFVCSWSDYWHPAVPAEWREEAMAIMRQRRDVTFLLLTKRIERAPMRLPGNAEGCEHIWLGVSAENQACANKRIPALLEIDWPGKRFLSVEPMLGPIELDATATGQVLGACDECGSVMRNPHCEACDGLAGLDWVICGGESGPEARPTHPDWVRSLRDECTAARVPFMFKQWGEWVPYREDWPRGLHTLGGYWGDDGVWHTKSTTAMIVAAMTRYGKKRAGRELDGREWLERPGMSVDKVSATGQ